jgi:hypothetical protein
MSDRQIRRLQWRYENYGYDGLLPAPLIFSSASAR